VFNPASAAVLSDDAKGSTRCANANVSRVDELEYCPLGNWLENQLSAGSGWIRLRLQVWVGARLAANGPVGPTPREDSLSFNR